MNAITAAVLEYLPFITDLRADLRSPEWALVSPEINLAEMTSDYLKCVIQQYFLSGLCQQIVVLQF